MAVVFCFVSRGFPLSTCVVPFFRVFSQKRNCYVLPVRSRPCVAVRFRISKSQFFWFPTPTPPQVVDTIFLINFLSRRSTIGYVYFEYKHRLRLTRIRTRHTLSPTWCRTKKLVSTDRLNIFYTFRSDTRYYITFVNRTRFTCHRIE